MVGFGRLRSHRIGAIIAAGVIARLILAGAIGLGVDESYAVAVARPLSASYYDHPPLAFWMVGIAERLFGTRSDVLLRLPFIVLFAGTTWLMYLLAEHSFGERAGVITAALVTIVPVFGVADAGWILPDGPLLFGFALTALCLSHVLSADVRDQRWRWWVGAGIGAGIAALSKYHAIFLPLGALVFLATTPRERRWLRMPQPYAAAAIALFLALPVLVWNARLDWISLRFQSGRADVDHGLHLASFLQNLAGQAGYMLPWIWVPLVWLLVVALRRGPRDPARWLLVCLGAGPVLVFTGLSLGGRAGLPHWPAPGFLLLLPLLAEWLARRTETGARRAVGVYIVGSGVLVALLVVIAATQVRTGWMMDEYPHLFARGDPSLDALDWREARASLLEGSIADGQPIVAANWRDAGKLGAALAPDRAVLTAGDDPRHFAFVADQNGLSNRHAFAVIRSNPPAAFAADRERLQQAFATLDSVGAVAIHRHGRTALTLVEYEASGPPPGRPRSEASVPFSPDERLDYAVSFGRIHVGSGSMQVLGVDTVGGHAAWHAMMTVSGGLPMFHVRDTTISWFDVGDFDSRRFVQHIHEGHYHAERDFEIDPLHKQFVENDKPAAPSTADPLDDVSLLYFVRTLPLIDGDRYELPRYFQPAGNPVVIRVIRHEQITVPAGKYRAILVEPEIATAGIFSHSGRAQLWFSDDSARVLLQMKSHLSFGSINLYLTRIGS